MQILSTYTVHQGIAERLEVIVLVKELHALCLEEVQEAVYEVVVVFVDCLTGQQHK